MGVAIVTEPAVILRPLVLDLDRTLLRTDVLHEMLVWVARHRPMLLLRVPFWLTGGRAHLKHRLAAVARVDFATLPANPEVEEFGRTAAANGHSVYVATASPVAALGGLIARFPFVGGVFATSGSLNLKGEEKASLLKREFPGGFDYIGDSPSDLPVWKSAGHATVFARSSALPRAAERAGLTVTQIVPGRQRSGARRALRLHQWMKNALIFVPMILSGHYTSVDAVIAVVSAFFALSLVASGTYVVNDLLDLENDRGHWSKHDRPLASGVLRLDAGVGLAVAAIAGGLGLAAVMAPAALPWVGAYVFVTLAYSMWLKRVVLLDCFVLAALFTLRLAVGTAASGAPPSPWLFIFSMFVFTSLSLAKRNTELLRAAKHGREGAKARGYRAEDQPLVLGLGLSSAISAVLVIILYLTNDAFSKVFYRSVEDLWALPALVTLFLARVWLVGQRGELNDDPTVFAARDNICRGIGVMMAVAVLAALFV